MRRENAKGKCEGKMRKPPCPKQANKKQPQLKTCAGGWGPLGSAQANPAEGHTNEKKKGQQSRGSWLVRLRSHYKSF